MAHSHSHDDDHGHSHSHDHSHSDSTNASQAQVGGFIYGIDTLRPAFDDRPIPYIAYGSRFPELCADHVPNTLGANRVYIIASKSLSDQTPALKRLQKALGSKLVGTRVGMKPHTRWTEVLSVIAECRQIGNVDCIITLGAGSLTDASKVIAWALAQPDFQPSDLESMWHDNPSYNGQSWKPPTIRVISIPTSLSGGEYQSIAGVTTDSESHPNAANQKRLFTPPVRNPSLVILDPDLTTTTPQSVWLSTGIRAVDHCVETLCSLVSNAGGDASAAKGLNLLVPALLRCKQDPSDLDARYQSMMGVIEAINALVAGVPMGASHAIGHQLGPMGVGHGETSCILLPSVCQWNKSKLPDNKEYQERSEKCRSILIQQDEVKRLVDATGRAAASMDLGAILDLVIRQLGMPRSLKAVSIGRDRMDELAENSLKDHWSKTNAVPITEKAQVMEILEMVAG